MSKILLLVLVFLLGMCLADRYANHTDGDSLELSHEDTSATNHKVNPNRKDKPSTSNTKEADFICESDSALCQNNEQLRILNDEVRRLIRAMNRSYYTKLGFVLGICVSAASILFFIIILFMCGCIDIHFIN